MAHQGLLTIGRVVKKLQAQYPDLTVSKVRYLEYEGLVDPIRSESGYRSYTTSDIARIEEILYLQQHQHLPLTAIKEKLLRTRESTSAPRKKKDESSRPTHTDSIEKPSYRLYPLDRIPEVSGASISFARELNTAGLIAFKRSPQGRDLVDSRDIPLIRAAHDLTHYGIGPKNLRQYVIATNRESALFEHALVVFATRGGGVLMENTKASRDRFNKAFDDILALTGSIRAQLIRKKIQATFSANKAVSDPEDLIDDV